MTDKHPHAHPPGTEPEPVVDGVWMVPEAVGLCEEEEGRLGEGLQHAQEASHAAGLAGVLVHQDAAQVQEATVAVSSIQPHHLPEDSTGSGENTHPSHISLAKAIESRRTCSKTFT